MDEHSRNPNDLIKGIMSNKKIRESMKKPSLFTLLTWLMALAGSLLMWRVSLTTQIISSLISTLLQCLIALIGLGAVVVTLLWPQYVAAVDGIQNSLKAYAGIVFETHDDTVRGLEYFSLVLKRLEEVNDEEVQLIWRDKNLSVNWLVLHLARYLYSISWYINPFPIEIIKNLLLQSPRFRTLADSVDIEVTLKSIVFRLRPEALLEAQFNWVRPDNYLLNVLDHSFPYDMKSKLFYSMQSSGYFNLRTRVAAYQTVTKPLAYLFYFISIAELIAMIAELQLCNGQAIGVANVVSRVLITGFIFVSTVTMLNLLKLLLGEKTINHIDPVKTPKTMGFFQKRKHRA